MNAEREPDRVVALTGATGFLGRHLLDRLCRDGWRVRALARRPGALADAPRVSVVAGDLADRQALASLVDGAEVVVHCAGLTRGASRAAFHAVNTEGTGRVVVAASGASPRPRFILISSLAAREPGLSDYAASKRGAEDALRRLGDELDWNILRPPAVYGPGDSATLPFFKLVKRGVMLRPGAGRGDAARLALIYVDDLTAAVTAAVSAGLPPRSVFELSDPCPEGHTWRAIGDIGARVLGTKVRHIPVPFGLMTLAAAANVVTSRVLGGSPMMTPGKVREMFHPNWSVAANPLAEYVDWQPKVTVEDGFARTARWYRENHLL